MFKIKNIKKLTSKEKSRLKEKILVTAGGIFSITSIPLLASGVPPLQCIGCILLANGGGMITMGALSGESPKTQTEWRKDLKILNERNNKYINNDMSNS
jgi:hypothetical protein